MERRWWALVASSVFATEVVVDVSQHLSLGLAVGYGVANTIEPVVGALAFFYLNPDRTSLAERRGKLSFLVGAVGAGCLVGALVGATVAVRQRPGSSWLTNVWHWWTGDGVAVLAIGATILLVRTSTLSNRRRWELAAAATATTGVTFVGLLVPLVPATVILPVLAVLAFVFGPVGATLGGGVVALVAHYATNAGHGYFAKGDVSPGARMALLQLFIAVLVIVG